MLLFIINIISSQIYLKVKIEKKTKKNLVPKYWNRLKYLNINFDLKCRKKKEIENENKKIKWIGFLTSTYKQAETDSFFLFAHL